MSIEILDCLKRQQDTCVKNVIPSQNTAFMFTPALIYLQFFRNCGNIGQVFFSLSFLFSNLWLVPQMRYINLKKKNKKINRPGKIARSGTTCVTRTECFPPNQTLSTVSPGLSLREIRSEQKTGTKFNKMAAAAMFIVEDGEKMAK